MGYGLTGGYPQFSFILFLILILLFFGDGAFYHGNPK
ncbi:hypothetical protein J2Z49_001956 [Desulfofundulus luciae]|uniref:Sporulation protein YjcZ n=1 Tax=Desulfofundulus luciae TaxID=74702 RepID=A0ABU0B3H5_9FIRM|nr:hypothetical protein [Desulfofundulus luciae]